jgi:signal transduction histidine kinase
MLKKELLEKLDYKDKEQLLQGLQEIIEHTYTIEDEFKELKNINSIILDFLPDALWVFDESGHIYMQNEEATKISDLISKIDSNQKSQELEFKNRTYLVKSTKAGEKLLILATDITEQKRASRLASMGQVAAHLSHEIRNPIGSISLLASTLMGRVKLSNKPIVLEIKKSIYRVERIIKSTLLFTKGVKISKEPFLLENLAEVIEESFEHYARTKDIELEISFENCEIVADFELLSIVMQNFLYNCVDAIEEDENDEGRILFLYKDGEIIVKDSGVEIEDENILYEPFETTKLKGSGLGLALSLEIIKAHNGKIELLEGEKGFRICLG